MSTGIVVLGCHRSGTSASTAALAALGVSTGLGPLVEGQGNDAGHHEPFVLRSLNDELLHRLGGNWIGPPDLPRGWTADARLEPVRHRARAAFSATFASTPWVWKDPRCCLTLPFWVELTGLHPLVVVVHRDPAEVARSLADRDGLSTAVGLAIWERYVRAALHSAVGHPTAVTTYDRLVADPHTWIEELAPILDAAEIERTGASAVTGGAVRADLRHHRATSSPTTVPADQPAITDLVAALTSLDGFHPRFAPPDLPPPTPWLQVLLAEAGRAHDDRRRAARTIAEQRPAIQPLVNRTRLKAIARRLLPGRITPRTPETTVQRPRVPRPRQQLPDTGQLERFALFVGYPRSGHSLVGSLLDAHPDVVIAHELDVLEHVREGVERHDLFLRLLEHDREFTEGGRQWMGYDYHVPGSWQGRTRSLRVIGDKKGGATAERLAADPGALDRLQALVGLPLVLLHVVRNPYDNIATIATRSGMPLAACVSRYGDLLTANERLRRRVADDPGITWSDIAHERLVAEPRSELATLAEALRVDPDPEWIEAAAAIVFPEPRRTRHDVHWTTELVNEVAGLIEGAACLADYAAVAHRPALAPT